MMIRWQDTYEIDEWIVELKVNTNVRFNEISFLCRIVRDERRKVVYFLTPRGIYNSSLIICYWIRYKNDEQNVQLHGRQPPRQDNVSTATSTISSSSSSSSSIAHASMEESRTDVLERVQEAKQKPAEAYHEDND